MKAMLLHYAGEAVFELSDVVGVENDNFAETKRKLTEYFRPQCNEEYEIFKFRRADGCRDWTFAANSETLQFP